jgi:hypothetical protein
VLDPDGGGPDRIVVVNDRSGPANRMSPTAVIRWAGPRPVLDDVSESATKCAVPAASVRATDWRMRARAPGEPCVVEAPGVPHAAAIPTSRSATPVRHG